mgnify:FL=1
MIFPRLLVIVSLVLSWGSMPNSSGSALAEDASRPLRLRVLTYNIHHGEGVDGVLDLPRIARVIDSVEPDIVALQEVDQKTRRAGEVDQPAELAQLTKRNVVFGGNFRFQGGEYGNAVLSRLPIVRHENHLLPSFGGGEQRGVLEVEIRLPDQAGTLAFLATHLDFRPGDRERLESVRAITALVADSPDGPALVAGDLNALPDSTALRAFEAAHWTRANKEILPTSPVVNPRRQIDYVLYRPGNRWRVAEVRVLDEAVASDHRPVLAVLELVP